MVNKTPSTNGPYRIPVEVVQLCGLLRVCVAHGNGSRLLAAPREICRVDEAVLEITSADGRVSALFGSQVIESRYEKKVSQTGVNSQEHVSAKRRAQQAN
jgi:hypothetical protein